MKREMMTVALVMAACSAGAMAQAGRPESPPVPLPEKVGVGILLGCLAAYLLYTFVAIVLKPATDEEGRDTSAVSS